MHVVVDGFSTRRVVVPPSLISNRLMGGPNFRASVVFASVTGVALLFDEEEEEAD
jgi:hypothetical protein